MQKAIAAPDVRLQKEASSPELRRLVTESPCFTVQELSLTPESMPQWSWLLGHADGHTTLNMPDPVQGRIQEVRWASGSGQRGNRQQPPSPAHGHVHSQRTLITGYLNLRGAT
jgi:hypothetical protein